MSTLPRLRASSFSCCLVLLPLLGTIIGSAGLLAQAPSAAAAAKPASGASGFSIETEMLTYRALESNGEAIACDVAAYLYNTKTDFRDLPSGTICNVGGSGASNIGVVVLPFDRAVFADFQIWRSDMQAMAEFEVRGANACKAAATTPPAHAAEGEPEQPHGRGLTASSTTSAVAAVGGVAGALTPAGAMLSTGTGILSLFAKSQESSPVGGTIEDQAFMDDVSRELRSVHIAVLMPSAYSPYGMTSIDPARSPFVTALDKLLHTRDCLVASRNANDPDLKNIEDFLAVLSGSTTPAKSTAPTSGSPASGGSSGSASASHGSSDPSASGGSSGASASGASSAAAAAPNQAHLTAVYTADGLAQRLGADPATGKIPDNAPHYLLMVKALESGGSVNRSSSIFGSKMSYSGGSVGTYALFGLDGDLECSGNVYDYAGYVSAKDFQKHLREYKPDPHAQVIFQRGECRAH
jgi:hypothetical protein